MAESDLQKSVQGIKDPTARKAAYYSAQRKGAEAAANKGDVKGALTSGKIQDKLASGKGDYERSKAWFGKTGADVQQGINKASEYAMLGPEGAAGKAVAGAAGKLIPRAEEAIGNGAKALEGKLGQFLGKARPVASKTALPASKKALTGGKEALPGGAKALPASKKALTSGKTFATAAPKKLSGSDFERAGMGANKGIQKTGSKAYQYKTDQLAPSKPASNMAKALSKNATNSKGRLLKPAGKSSSSPAARESLESRRQNPKTGERVGKDPVDTKYAARSRANRQNKLKDTGDTNKAASGMKPRDRNTRNADLGKAGRAGSGKKGTYKPAKLKSAAEAKG